MADQYQETSPSELQVGEYPQPGIGMSFRPLSEYVAEKEPPTPTEGVEANPLLDPIDLAAMIITMGAYNPAVRAGVKTGLGAITKEAKALSPIIGRQLVGQGGFVNLPVSERALARVGETGIKTAQEGTALAEKGMGTRWPYLTEITKPTGVRITPEAVTKQTPTGVGNVLQYYSGPPTDILNVSQIPSKEAVEKVSKHEISHIFQRKGPKDPVEKALKEMWDLLPETMKDTFLKQTPLRNPLLPMEESWKQPAREAAAAIQQFIAEGYKIEPTDLPGRILVKYLGSGGTANEKTWKAINTYAKFLESPFKEGNIAAKVVKAPESIKEPTLQDLINFTFSKEDIAKSRGFGPGNLKFGRESLKREPGELQRILTEGTKEIPKGAPLAKWGEDWVWDPISRTMVKQARKGWTF